ncbi:hypothetical protein D3C85_1485170 [compost metagenome]
MKEAMRQLEKVVEEIIVLTLTEEKEVMREALKITLRESVMLTLFQIEKVELITMSAAMIEEAFLEDLEKEAM